MDAEPIAATPPKRKRRWCQFRLRTLMIVVVICSVDAAWLGRKLDQKRRERAAVKAVEELGGWAEYAKSPSGDRLGPSWLRQILGDDFYSDVVWVAFGARQIDDSRLSILSDLPYIESLELGQQDISDAGVAKVHWSMNLKCLVLDETRITDSALRTLRSLTQLEGLYLRGTRVTDRGIADLQLALPRCRIFR